MSDFGNARFVWGGGNGEKSKKLSLPLSSANFPQIPADFPADIRRGCEPPRGNLRL